jgi:hypothetical protein
LIFESSFEKSSFCQVLRILLFAQPRVSETIEMPHRPPWSLDESKDAVEARENKYFEKWLSGIYSKYSADRLNFFEHNLEVWLSFLQF